MELSKIIDVALLDSLQKMAEIIEEKALVVCRVLPSTRTKRGYQVQLGHRDSYRNVVELPNAQQAASYLQGLAHAWILTGRITDQDVP